jgi:16S rRNA (cytidine1402-2'-O)-methyltransferase
MGSLDGLIAESERAGRMFLSRFETKKPAKDIPIALLDKHASKADLDFLLEPLVENGECWGVLSDAGLPCVADPGAPLVARARQCGVDVEAHSGPSSIMLSLMLSGFGGQQFVFHGYIARQPEQRKKELLRLEQLSGQGLGTQIFIEAPYRNQATLEAMVKELAPETRLCVCWDLSTDDEGVVSQSIEAWRQHELPDIHKRPATFLVLAQPGQARPAQGGRAKRAARPKHRKARFHRR